MGSLPWVERELSRSRAAADSLRKTGIPSSGEYSFRSVRYHQMRPDTRPFFSGNVLCRDESEKNTVKEEAIIWYLNEMLNRVACCR